MKENMAKIEQSFDSKNLGKISSGNNSDINMYH